jgi:3-dehydroquinate dehydratase I
VERRIYPLYNSPVDKICISIGERPKSEIRSLLAGNSFVELRLDLISDFEPLEELLKTAQAKIIVTCRAGRFSEAKRVELLKRAIESNCFAVDLEYDNPAKELIQLAKTRGVKVIISYHNSVNTPSTESLQRVVEEALKLGADIVKIACEVKSSRDSARLIGLLDSETPLIISGMGEQGKLVRIVAPLFGSLCSFSSVDKDSMTATGQLTQAEMSSSLETLSTFLSR